MSSVPGVVPFPRRVVSLGAADDESLVVCATDSANDAATPVPFCCTSGGSDGCGLPPRERCCCCVLERAAFLGELLLGAFGAVPPIPGAAVAFFCGSTCFFGLPTAVVALSAAGFGSGSGSGSGSTSNLIPFATGFGWSSLTCFPPLTYIPFCLLRPLS